jgi:hypothetical protein
MSTYGDLDSLTDDQRSALLGTFLDGTAEAQMLHNTPGCLRTLNLTSYPYRYESLLLGRVSVWGNEPVVCASSIDPGGGDEVYYATTVTETRTRGSNTMVITTTYSPGGVSMAYATGGVHITPPACTSHTDTDKSAGYDADIHETTIEYDYGGTISLEGLAGACAGGEIKFSTDAWGVRQSFGRRWWDENAIGGLGPVCYNRTTGVRRFVYELKMSGHRIPGTLLYDMVTTPADADPYTDSYSLSFAPGLWDHTIDHGYPPFGSAAVLTNARFIPV